MWLLSQASYLKSEQQHVCQYKLTVSCYMCVGFCSFISRSMGLQPIVNAGVLYVYMCTIRHQKDDSGRPKRRTGGGDKKTQLELGIFSNSTGHILQISAWELLEREKGAKSKQTNSKIRENFHIACLPHREGVPKISCPKYQGNSTNFEFLFSSWVFDKKLKRMISKGSWEIC